MNYFKILQLFFFLIIFNSFDPSVVFGQKPVLDSSVWGNWPYIGAQPILSSDGRFLIYAVEGQPRNSRTLFVKNLKSGIDVKFPGVASWDVELAGDRIIYPAGDSVCILKLGEDVPEYFSGVTSHKVFKKNNRDYVAFQFKGAGNDSLLIRSVAGPEQIVINGVKSWWLSPDGSSVIFKRSSVSATKDLLYYRKLNNSTDKLIFSGKVIDVKFDREGEQAVLLSRDSGTSEDQQSVWYFREGMNDFKCITDKESSPIRQDSLFISGISRFSKEGKRVFLTLRKRKHSFNNEQERIVAVWSYKDLFLQTQQMQMGEPADYVGIIDIDGDNFIRLTGDNEKIFLGDGTGQDSILPLRYQVGSNVEAGWNPRVRSEQYVLFTENGKRVRLEKNLFPNVKISPTGRYIYAFDSVIANYYSYDVQTGKEINLTGSLLIPKTESVDGLPYKKYYRGLMPETFWLPGDSGMIVYDKYDIWLLDPTAKQGPRNLTNGYGRRHGIQFRFASEFQCSRDMLRGRRYVYLTGFNIGNKEVGFYSMDFSVSGDPRLLSKGPFHYDVLLGGNPIVKAKNRDLYVVLRCDEKDAPNLFLTKDFMEFTSVTDIHPEENWNWLNVELKQWVMSDGIQLQGLLYKPEDFDSTKKYPVILTFYERLSDEMHSYRVPGPTNTLLNIPWFVSRGYLVFCPDITYTLGLPGRSALASIESAGRLLQGLPFVDGSKMGLQGYSFSGYETNYIITRTNMFRAAVSGAGQSNLISSYGTIMGQGGDSGAEFLERSQTRMGFSPWEGMDQYIENSPIFSIKNITTPLLLIHGSLDGLVPFSQGLEFFIGLRRMDKQVWLLQYNKSGHHIEGKDAEDYTIRMEQFFDYFLKGNSKLPVWMNSGIPYKSIEVERGINVDSSRIIP